MKHRICIIGVEDSIEMVKDISKEFENIAEFVFYSYSSVSDIIEFINKSLNIDVIMFTGTYPYNYFRKHSLIDIPYFTISKSNETLIETFWNIRESGINYQRVSIDRSPREEVLSIIDDLDISRDHIRLIGDSSEIALDEIYQFHKENYESKKVEAIISSNYKVYSRLKSEGYNVYRILPSKFILKDSIKKAIAMANTEKIKSSQVAIQRIRIRDTKEKLLSKYNQLKLINKFDDVMIDYTNDIQGSFYKFGNNEYLIFTTRGFISIGELDKKIGKLVEQSESIGLSLSMGIGYGESVLISEKNSQIGLKHALEFDKGVCFVVDDDSTITGPILGGDSVSYNLTNTDEEITALAKEVGISEKYLLKLKAIIGQKNHDRFTSDEMAEILNVSQRSALRILTKLENGKCAEVVGTTSISTKGRPKKIYQISLQ